MIDPTALFDRFRQRLLKEKSFSIKGSTSSFFLHRESEQKLIERFHYVQRSFSKILLINFLELPELKRTSVLEADHSDVVLMHSYAYLPLLMERYKNVYQLVAHEEMFPFPRESFDLVVSNLSLHHLNNVYGTLKQIKSLLKPGGLYLASFFGGESLKELRSSLLQAELEITGGAAMRIHPMITIDDALRLLTQAKFLYPVIDRDTITLLYPHLSALLSNIRQAGEGNSLSNHSQKILTKRIFGRAEEIYSELYQTSEGYLESTAEIIFLTGWAE